MSGHAAPVGLCPLLRTLGWDAGFSCFQCQMMLAQETRRASVPFGSVQKQTDPAVVFRLKHFPTVAGLEHSVCKTCT